MCTKIFEEFFTFKVSPSFHSIDRCSNSDWRRVKNFSFYDFFLFLLLLRNLFFSDFFFCRNVFVLDFFFSFSLATFVLDFFFSFGL